MKFVVTAVVLLSLCLVPTTLDAGTFKSRVCVGSKVCKERVRLLPLKRVTERRFVKRVVTVEIVEIPVETVGVTYSSPIRNFLFGKERIVPCANCKAK